MQSLFPFLGLALAVFVTALGVPFYLDDFALLQDPIVTSTDGWWRSWGPLQTRPLTWFTFWLNYQLGGESPAGYHALNLAIHLACAWLLRGALAKLLAEPAALFAAVLFLIHPVQSEPVVYVFARATLLMSLFCLLSLRAWVGGRLWLAVLWFGVALLAKEECVTFPLFLGLLHWTGARDRPGWKAIGAMLALSAVAGLRVIWATSVITGSGAGTQAGVGPIDYFLTQGLAIWHYARLLVAPVGLSLESPLEVTRWGWLGWLGVAAFVVWAARRLDRNKPAFWLLAGLVLLLASSSIFPAADLSAERRLYLPMLGFGSALALLVARWPPSRLGLALALALLSYWRVQQWRDPAEFWRRASEAAPARARPAIQYARQLSPNEAIPVLARTQSLAPDNRELASEMGGVYLESGDAARALASFGRALAMAPSDPYAINNRGVALERLGQREAAVADFRRALQFDPCLFDARLNLRRLGAADTAQSGCRYTPRQRALLEGN